jgi:hypothetical protein
MGREKSEQDRSHEGMLKCGGPETKVIPGKDFMQLPRHGGGVGLIVVRGHSPVR